MTGLPDFTLHPGAYADLDSIEEYVAQYSAVAAGRVIANIHDAIRMLVQSPNVGHRRPDLTSRPLRFWAVREYLIAYAPDERPLLVIAILRGQRNPRLLRAMLASR